MSLHSDQREDEESISGSSEAKTDRYGFLLVNGDTNNDSSDDLSPELVRHREMKWINLMSQWDQVLEKKHSKIKTQCQKGIPASVRSKCWPLLCGATQRKQSNKDLYKTLASSPGQQSWIDVIKRDTDRQFPFHEMFQSKDSHGQQGLLQVLKVYTQFRPDEGYCQAQGPVAAVLLMHMPMEEAFWCLVQISELYLPGYYSPLLEGVLFDAAILFGVLKRTCPAAYKHMQKQGVEPLMFATDWLMCLYTRHLPFNTLLRIWDLFFCNGVRVLFQVAVVLVRRCLGEARQRRECEGQMETLERLRSVKGRIQQEQADGFIQEVCSVPLSLAALQRQTEKELEKWRKERPSSTFDPRDRFHGYHMIWEKGKETENIKKERQRGNLRVPVMRSHSSLSPVALRKKWRKRGSKTETEDWEEKEFTKPDSDEEERRRASVCGVAGELRANTQEFNTHFQKERNTMANTQRISAMETDPVTDCNDTVFEEDENSVVVIAIPPDTHGGDHVEETRPSASLKEVDSQTAIIQQETRNKHSTEAWQVEEKKEQDDQDEEISTHQDQPEAQTQQEESQFSQIEDARNKLEEETQENKSKQEEETELETANPEEEEQLNINATEEEVNSIQQEVEVEINTDIKEKTEKENEINSDQEEEVEMGNSKQEEEIHLGTTIEVVICDSEIQEKEIKTKRIEHVVEIQEGKIEDAEEVEARNSKQEIEIQEPNEIKANNGKHELGNQEEKEMKANDREQEMKIQLEMGSKANNSEQEVEIVNGDQQANNANEEERLNLCLVHTIDVRTLKQQQQEDSERKIEDEETFQMEEETHLNAQTPEVRKDAVDVKGDPCESGNNTDRETIQQQQEGEREKEARITDTPDEETEETITEEEKRSSHNLTMAQDASNAVASSNIQQETAMKPSAQSETPQDSNKPQDENTDANKISEPERTTESKNPAPPQPDKKEVEAEAEIEFNVTPEPNLVKLPSGANQQPQLRLRRSSSSHTSYPTILSEDTFRNPQQSVERDSYPRTTNSPAESDIVQPKQTQRQNSKLNAPQKQSDKPKRKGLFQRLRADTPSIPKIVIQDFSEGEEKLSSKERRRRRRMQERKEKEEEKERKKLEKELGKEKTKERKKPQTRGKSFQVLSSKRDDDDVVTGRSSTQAAGRKRTSYSESYF